MHRLVRRLALVAGLAIALFPASGSTKAKPFVLPPYAGAYEPVGVDERGLWMEVDEDERMLRDSKFVITDPDLNGYVRGVLCRTVGQDRCNAARLYIVRIPYFNADMAPNGMMRVWSGLLLRVRSEAELAAVLGHEFAHFEERHTLARYKTQRTATDIAAWASFFGTYGAMVQTSMIGATYAFSRAEESQADIRSFTYVAASPYRPGAAADVWERLMAETDATAIGRHLRSTRYDKVSFFATHPTNLQRATYLRQLAVKDGDDGNDEEAGYRAAMSKWRPIFLADQVKLNDFAGTEYLLGQLAQSGWTPDLLFARAELYRLRGNPRDLVSAAGFYREAIAQGLPDPEARRGLGLALLRSQSRSDGCQALREYLAMKPDAQDASMISLLIQQSQTN